MGSLSELSLRGNAVRDAVMVGRAVQAVKGLKSLDVSRNQIDSLPSDAFVDLVAEGGMVDWIHRTVVIDYPSACLGAPHNPHRGSLWLMQWHRPLLRFTEADQHVDAAPTPFEDSAPRMSPSGSGLASAARTSDTSLGRSLHMSAPSLLWTDRPTW